MLDLLHILSLGCPIRIKHVINPLLEWFQPFDWTWGHGMAWQPLIYWFLENGGLIAWFHLSEIDSSILALPQGLWARVHWGPGGLLAAVMLHWIELELVLSLLKPRFKLVHFILNWHIKQCRLILTRPPSNSWAPILLVSAELHCHFLCFSS